MASRRNPNPGSEAGRVQRVRTETARKVQSVEQSGRPAGWRLAGRPGDGVYVLGALGGLTMLPWE
jgi:hypothetical protein